ncbi:hypothetical protein jhhlp_002009 [Lomentospora prolificans]|uniref:Selenoprotein W-like protein n=1 Tax=Lomentospora prolificans TaxID=41688 RepID=A0A2N3NCV7_9PEZI|nr:hypothetical protein jhhlp_002009 [Lomentospora prolificans]
MGIRTPRPAMAEAESKQPLAAAQLAYPRVTIEYCTQCKWMLRAAYYAQELLSTFQSDLAEVTLRPSRGGTFIISIAAVPPAGSSSAPADPTAQQQASVITKVIWNRTVDGGFPETKELKRRVRDVIDPDRNLGHNDRQHGLVVAAQKDDTPRRTVSSAGQSAAGDTIDTSKAGVSEAKSCVPHSSQGCQDCE